MAKPANTKPTIKTGIKRGLSVFLNAWYNTTGAINIVAAVYPKDFIPFISKALSVRILVVKCKISHF